MKKSVKRELIFAQPPEEVWLAITDSAYLAEWMYPNNFIPRMGHRFTFEIPANPQVKFEGMTVQCEVLKCDAPSELLFSWIAGGVDTLVEYRLVPDGHGTKVLFEHSGFENEQAFTGAGFGWNNMHQKLMALLSKGL